MRLVEIPGFNVVHQERTGETQSCLVAEFLPVGGLWEDFDPEEPFTFGIWYLTSGYANDSESSLLSIHCISESVPLHRFHHLINEGLFDDAESFALKHSLDDQVRCFLTFKIVRKSRITSILDKLEDDADSPAISLQKVVSILETIEV